MLVNAALLFLDLFSVSILLFGTMATVYVWKHEGWRVGAMVALFATPTSVVAIVSVVVLHLAYWRGEL